MSSLSKPLKKHVVEFFANYLVTNGLLNDLQSAYSEDNHSECAQLDYGCIAYYALPEYQMKRLQRVQTTCAGNVLGRYAVLGDLRKLNWLPIIKRRDMALLKITHKALYDDVWPDYLRHKFHTVSAYNSSSLEVRKLAIPDYNKFVRLAMKLMFSEGESVWLIFTCTYFFKKHSVLFLNLLYISFLI